MGLRLVIRQYWDTVFIRPQTVWAQVQNADRKQFRLGRCSACNGPQLVAIDPVNQDDFVLLKCEKCGKCNAND